MQENHTHIYNCKNMEYITLQQLKIRVL